MGDFDEHLLLRGIAVWELDHGHHGDFLRAFLQAYLRADMANEKLLRPVMEAFCVKYKLKDGYTGGE